MRQRTADRTCRVGVGLDAFQHAPAPVPGSRTRRGSVRRPTGCRRSSRRTRRHSVPSGPGPRRDGQRLAAAHSTFGSGSRLLLGKALRTSWSVGRRDGAGYGDPQPDDPGPLLGGAGRLADPGRVAEQRSPGEQVDRGEPDARGRIRVERSHSSSRCGGRGRPRPARALRRGVPSRPRRREPSGPPLVHPVSSARSWSIRAVTAAARTEDSSSCSIWSISRARQRPSGSGTSANRCTATARTRADVSEQASFSNSSVLSGLGRSGSSWIRRSVGPRPGNRR